MDMVVLAATLSSSPIPRTLVQWPTSQSWKGSEEGRETSTHLISTAASFLIDGIHTRKPKLGNDYLKFSKKGENHFTNSNPSRKIDMAMSSLASSSNGRSNLLKPFTAHNCEHPSRVVDTSSVELLSNSFAT
ncbi:putative pyruvate dehydrogenase E1 component subunit alpha-1 [Sesbania bispinosa]|nr:putative pyruvate dehydrogenase E1 component subunit alpha-1 [Sesbania bispinosa]